MHALASLPRRAPRGTPPPIALLGVGTVGSALLARMARLHADGATLPPLVYVANSRRALSAASGLDPCRARALASDAAAGTLPATGHAIGATSCGIVVDATGSESVAARHAEWLDRGLHVVTASKLGQGGPFARWAAIRRAQANAGAQYGDSATVGAGLPLLRSLRALREGGDAILGVAGVLSGSMAWLFGAFDGHRPFSGFVRGAREAGYTEPDPREDLSGEDVRRKLLILARAAGFALEPADVEVESLVPASLASVPLAALDEALGELDGPLRERYAAAWRRGERLRHVARLDVQGDRVRARVGLESLAPEDPLCGGSGTDNRVAILSDRYPTQPLLIQGPGAGAEVTAAALLDDVLRIARSAG